jgi:hypothetical protein
VGLTGERTGSSSNLVVGVPGEDVGSVTNAGTVHTISNANAAGPWANDILNQNSSGLSDSVEAGDAFGAGLVVHYNGVSGVYNLVVGAPREDVGSISDAGVVYFLLRNITWRQLWMVSQNTAGIPDTAERGDRFGTTVAVASSVSTPTGLRDLIVVGSPYENVGSAADAGLVQVINGDGTSLFTLSQSTSGIAGSPASGDHFGAAVDGIFLSGPLLISAPDDTSYTRGVVHGIGWSRLFTGSGSTYTLTPGPNGRRFGVSIAST